MTARHTATIALTAIAVASAGLGTLIPHLFAGRLPLRLTVSQYDFSGLPRWHVPGSLRLVDQALTDQPVTLALHDHTVTRALGELGLALDYYRTNATILQQARAGLFGLYPQHVTPAVTVDKQQLQHALAEAFAGQLDEPQNATLGINQSSSYLIPGKPGEVIDLETLTRRLAAGPPPERPVVLDVVTHTPAISSDAALALKPYVDQLLRAGLTMTAGEETVTLQPTTLQRLLVFREHPSGSGTLAAAADADALEQYLRVTVAPAIERQPQDARFEMQDGKVAQFSLPRAGRRINVAATLEKLNTALTAQQESFTLTLEETQPAISDTSAIEDMGITTLLAVGESDYAGSPANRQHNIAVGAERYHGLLIPPGRDFSFNEFLGPVTAAAGFRPELVIKSNVTVPEYGGGLCQVSTTMFRAALNAGLKITQRRNHSYAVRYYGIPGLDATIYPPYTDLRFQNNTPGYILIQRRLEGSKLMFEFWGTDDGRHVEVIGPRTYDRRPDGSLKASAAQKVTKGGQTLIEDTFYSRYKSPKLFPTIVSANRG